MAQYILDTDISSYLIRGDHETVTKKFSELYDSCAISSITAAELQYGAKKRNNKQLTQKVKAFCDLVEIIPWDEDAAKAYAKLRVELETSGTPIGNMDMLIAASALARKAVLVTNNTEHFSRVKDLKLGNWC
ncbi:MAG: type II toxin-antitoxin system VapC family toxin [Lentisphaeria bacterium]|nr:type II toxin-antitoxin system VapC family toxin [Lentisphaeria bacterium]